MTPIVDQPPPVATGRRPTWEIVIAYVEQNCSTEAAALVLPDMRERDTVGRERYGTPLTAGNGRDHLVDAYQELLDSSVYFANELSEYSVTPEMDIQAEDRLSFAVRTRLCCVRQLFVSQLHALIETRRLIEGRVS